ncbi:MAG TPA: PQQ-binding-like beta-propeller repeat protein [Solirubrobacteraceae bacterium]|nr:PQQ-binding-like beta-propeller repeat protein [Solirubrobacteraceae bacterium]
MPIRVTPLLRGLAAAATLVLTLLAAHPAAADWTTYHGDGARDGVDRTAGAARPFRALWSAQGLAGPIWAQPLVYRGLVIVVTETNDVVAYRAASGRRAWRRHLGTPVPASALPCGDIAPTVGITSTPVIDPRSGRLFVVADLRRGQSAQHRLFALDARTGRVRFGRAVDPPSDPLNQLQREGLALDRGRILIGYGGNDGDCAQYRGFLVSAPADDRGATTMYAVPTAREGAIWSAGGAPAIDRAGHVFVPTGNAANGPGRPFDHGDTLEKLSPLGRELDYWAPASWAQDSAADADLGSVSPALLPGGLVFQGGKNGRGYLVSTTRMGHIGGERYSAPVCDSFGSDAFTAGTLLVACTSGVRALAIDARRARFSSRWNGPGDADGSPIVAAGRVWVASTSDDLLYGLDLRTGAVRVRQAVPAMEHFVTPAAADGRLFLATGTSLAAFRVGADRR